MIVDWSPEAIDDLAHLRATIAADNPAAARKIASRILDAVETLLPDHPGMGRPGRVSGTRELVVPQTSYIVPYRVRGDVIQVLRVYHGRRRWPAAF